MYPTIDLQPGSMNTAAVKQLQDYLVSQGYMTAAQEATGPGTYGPQTTAAVKAWQQAKGVNNSSGPGYWGPLSIAAASGSSNTNTNTSTTQTPITSTSIPATLYNPTTGQTANT